MKLKKLKLKNIRSYEEEEIIFPDGSTLLSGDIGSGKTSVLLAIEYALFGLQPGQRGSSLLSNGKDFGGVILEFEINGKEIIIERTLKRSSKTISQDYTSITIDNEKIESSVTEIKTKVLELLNYPQEFIKKNNLLYRYTVYTPQEEMKQIVLEDAESRLNVLRHIFGIDKYKKIKENLAILTGKLREESRILQVEIRDLDEKKNKLEANKKFVNVLNEKLENKNLELGKITKDRKFIENSVLEIEQKVKEKENFKKEVEKTDIMLINKKEQLAKEEKFIMELEEKISKHKDLFEEMILEEVINQIKDKNEVLNDINKNYIEIFGKINSFDLKKQEDLEKKNRIFKIDICPTCLQDVSETHKHNILNATETELKRIENLQKDLKTQLNGISNSLEEEKISLLGLENKKSELGILKVKTEELKFSQEKLVFSKKSRENLIKDIGDLERHVELLKQSAFDLTKYDNLLKLKNYELKQALQREKEAEIEIAELRKELQITKREIQELLQKIKETEKVKERLLNIIDLENWLSGDFLNLINFTEKNIMLTLRNEFSKLFNTWFLMLTTDAFYVNLDENFTPIITQGDFELDYSYLSGGERTAVALAYRLALNQILNSILSEIKTRGLVILDEPTDGFSEQQLDKVRDILQELKVAQLILVSHEQKIESFVDNVIRFKKEGGLSRKE